MHEHERLQKSLLKNSTGEIQYGFSKRRQITLASAATVFQKLA